ncbi:MAG: DnaJ domain-containing protein [Alphaproteobacteria bacterium]|nr:DnaJ domain-containing protein [Alphaproteobacteria bacterium]
MIFYLLIGFILLVAILTIVRWLAYADTKKVMTTLKWAAFLLGGMILAVFVLKGWAGYLAGLLFGLIPAILRWRSLARTVGNFAKTARGPTRGQTSEVATRFFRMTLEHDSGAMDGEILEGRYRGRRLTSLGETDLILLHGEIRDEDEQSLEILEAYLDRTFGPEWRERAGEAEPEGAGASASSGGGGGGGGGGGRGGGGRGGGGGATGGAMTRRQALDVLGLEEGATPDEIRAAHRRLMQTHHPDRGGSSYLAAQINQAKDILLG